MHCSSPGLSDTLASHWALWCVACRTDLHPQGYASDVYHARCGYSGETVVLKVTHVACMEAPPAARRLRVPARHRTLMGTLRQRLAPNCCALTGPPLDPLTESATPHPQLDLSSAVCRPVRARVTSRRRCTSSRSRATFSACSCTARSSCTRACATATCCSTTRRSWCGGDEGRERGGEGTRRAVKSGLSIAQPLCRHLRCSQGPGPGSNPQRARPLFSSPRAASAARSATAWCWWPSGARAATCCGSCTPWAAA
jgi:hypothetical protein